MSYPRLICIAALLAVTVTAGCTAGGEPGRAGPGGKAGAGPVQPDRTSRVRPGDFDGDGREELVVSRPRSIVAGRHRAGGVAVYPGTRSGVSERPRVITRETPGMPGEVAGVLGDVIAYAGADFDRDARSDLAMLTAAAPGPRYDLVVFYGSRAGLTGKRGARFALGLSRAAHTSLEVADFNGDGYEDLATAGGPNTALVLPGGPKGSAPAARSG